MRVMFLGVAIIVDSLHIILTLSITMIYTKLSIPGHFTLQIKPNSLYLYYTGLITTFIVFITKNTIYNLIMLVQQASNP